MIPPPRQTQERRCLIGRCHHDFARLHKRRWTYYNGRRYHGPWHRFCPECGTAP